ncbi:MAG: hypothetical protein FWD54_06215 [Endomicrobia bacterium]|nr:hypothetical protein [Endomicrobiia bacterium]
MPKKIFVWMLLGIAFFTLCFEAKAYSQVIDDQIIITKSRIKDKKIVITDNLGKEIDYKIKGICYAPDIDDNVLYETFIKDIPLIKSAGANSIRTYRPLGCNNSQSAFDYQNSDNILNACFNEKITAAVGFSYDDMKDNGLLEQYLMAFGAHPAILMIVLGNEYNYHYDEWFTKEEWFSRLSAAVKKAKQQYAPNKIISVVHGGVPSKEEYDEYIAAGVDLIMMNLYVGDTFGFAKDDWDKISGSMPWCVSEFGRSSLDGAGKDTSKFQASMLQSLIRGLEHGGYLFSFVDDPSKGDAEFSPVIGREDSLGIYYKNRKPKISVNVVKQEYDKIPGAVYINGN